MKKSIDLKYTIIGLTLAGFFGLILAAFTNLSFWLAFGIVVFSMVVNGFIAEFEDNLPGGFNNPMTIEQIELENAKRRKKIYLSRVIVWSLFIALLCWMVWVYRNISFES